MMTMIDPPSRAGLRKRHRFSISTVALLTFGMCICTVILIFTNSSPAFRTNLPTKPVLIPTVTKATIRDAVPEGVIVEVRQKPEVVEDVIVEGFPQQYRKVQLSDWPSLRVFHHLNLLTKREAEYIISLAASQLSRSRVVGEKEKADVGAISDVRTSQGMFLQSYEHRNDPVVRAFRDRVSRATGHPEKNMEATQVLRYEGGEFYRAHPDYFDMDRNELIKRGGNRICTVLCYLNTPESGGATNFPSVNITVPAIGGNCVEFYSMKADGSPDPQSWHGALPPGHGAIKWSMPTWIREFEFR